MSVSYEGKKPGRIWYAWQKTMAVAATGLSKEYRKDARVGATGAALSAGSLYATSLVWQYLFLVPLLPTASAIVGCVAALYFGRQAYDKFQLVRKSSEAHSYLRRKENQWLEKKQTPRLGARIRTRLDKIKQSIRRTLLRAGKWAGFGTAAAASAGGIVAGLHMAGVSAVTAVTAPLVSQTIAAGAALGIGAAASVYGVFAITLLAVPVALGAGIVCKNKLREASAREENGTSGNRFLRRAPAADTEEASGTAPAAPAPAAAPLPKMTADFNAPSEPVPTHAAMPKSEDPARSAAAEERRLRRIEQRGKSGF